MRREGSERVPTGQGFTVSHHGKTIRTDRRKVRAFLYKSSARAHDYSYNHFGYALNLQSG